MIKSRDYDQYLGPLFKILNLIVFTTISIIMVKNHIDMPFLAQLFIMSTCGVIVLLPYMLITRSSYMKLNLKYIHWYILRSILGVTGLIVWIKATKTFGLNESTLVSYLIPILLIIIAAISRTERISLISLFTSFLCFIIVALVITYSFKETNFTGFLIAFTSSIIWACYDFICKKQTFNEHFLAQAFYILLIESIITAPFMINQTMISLTDLYTLCGVGILRVINVVFLFLAYKFSSLNSIAPLGYLRLPIMMIGAYLIFSTIPSLHLLGGSITIIIINVLLVKHNINHKKYSISKN